MPWTVRSIARETDLPQLVSLLTEVEAADQAGEDTSEATVGEQVAALADGNGLVVSPADDADRLIGFGGVWKAPMDERAYGLLVVHPAWRRRGIGGALLERLLARARKLQAAYLGVAADTRDAQANAFTRRHGFERMSAYTQLRAPGDLAVEAPVWPEGFSIRTVAEGIELARVTEALNAAYAGLWGHNTVTAAQVAERIPTWTPDGCFLLCAPDGAVAGICRAEMSQQLSARRGEPIGYIDAPGIVARYRAAGLYLPLVRTAVCWLYTQRPASIEMESWGDAPETLAQYATAGFAMVRQANQYRLALP